MLRIDDVPSRMTHDEFRQALVTFRDQSNHQAYALFNSGDPSDCVAVCLSGNGERFATLALLEKAECPCLAVQDPFSPWFTGSQICSGLDEVEHVIRETFPTNKRWLITGQSSGAYAALILSRRFDNNVTVAFSPQTFDDRMLKGQRLSFPPSFNIERTPEILDVAESFRQTSGAIKQSEAYLVASYTEHGNPAEGFYWCDALHWSRMLEFENVRVILSPTDIHPMLWRNTRGYAEALARVARQGGTAHDFYEHLKAAAYNPSGVS